MCIHSQMFYIHVYINSFIFIFFKKWILECECVQSCNFSAYFSETKHCCRLVAESWLTLCDLLACSLPSSSVREISQARILQWVVIFPSRGSSRPRDWTHVSFIGRNKVYKCASAGRSQRTSYWCRSQGSLTVAVSVRSSQSSWEVFLPWSLSSLQPACPARLHWARPGHGRILLDREVGGSGAGRKDWEKHRPRGRWGSPSALRTLI